MATIASEPLAASAHPLAAPALAWSDARPALARDYDRDAALHSAFWRQGLDLLAALPPKRDRTSADAAVAAHVLERSRQARIAFLAAHGATLYGKLTDGQSAFPRVEALAYGAAEAIPGLVPTQAAVAAEARLLQKEKDGHEIDQGILFNRFLGDPSTGLHLCHAMLRPRPEALDVLPRLRQDGRVDLGTAVVERHGSSSAVLMRNPRFLNAEDDTTLANMETAVDLALLDPDTSICVLRGDTIAGGKYDGQRVFSTGINLTHLYQGKIPYLWYLVRELGFVNKMFRGLAGDTPPDEVFGATREKPWVSVVERFAIGGGCQYLLATDYVLAESGAYMTLPARKEGIIPGAANLRLPRFVGDRIARQAIMYDRRIDCDSPEGRLICDQVVAADAIDAALAEVTERLTSSGVVSAASNRRAFRIAHEPLDLFRAYMAAYALDQANCHFSPALIRNLEQHWKAHQRSA